MRQESLNAFCQFPRVRGNLTDDADGRWTTTVAAVGIRRNISVCNVNVNISIFPIGVRRDSYRAKGTSRKAWQPRSPYWRTRRLRFTAVFSDFAYRTLGPCTRAGVCAWIAEHGTARSKKEIERGSRKKTNEPSRVQNFEIYRNASYLLVLCHIF